jgi:hypothetical protein
MENITDLSKKELYEVVDQLTEENQHFFLGILEALSFAQSAQELLESRVLTNSGLKCAD